MPTLDDAQIAAILAGLRLLQRQGCPADLDHGDDPRQILIQRLLRSGVQAAAEAAGRTARARAAC